MSGQIHRLFKNNMQGLRQSQGSLKHAVPLPAKNQACLGETWTFFPCFAPLNTNFWALYWAIYCNLSQYSHNQLKIEIEKKKKKNSINFMASFPSLESHVWASAWRSSSRLRSERVLPSPFPVTAPPWLLNCCLPSASYCSTSFCLSIFTNDTSHPL